MLTLVMEKSRLYKTECLYLHFLEHMCSMGVILVSFTIIIIIIIYKIIRYEKHHFCVDMHWECISSSLF